LLAGFVWHVADALDLRAMRAAADALLGEHDFRAFCRRPPGHSQDAPITRRVLDTRWSVASFLDRELGDLSDLSLAGSARGGSGRDEPHGVTSRTSRTSRTSPASAAAASVASGASGAQARGDAAPDDGHVDSGRLLRFDVRATSFCHQMVRSIVGTLVEVGRGRMRPSDIPRLLVSANRSGAKVLAPPHGLCLIGVDY
jgi:tRNA U38,U39,U40 pseudouridine synthase TruA